MKYEGYKMLNNIWHSLSTDTQLKGMFLIIALILIALAYIYKYKPELYARIFIDQGMSKEDIQQLKDEINHFEKTYNVPPKILTARLRQMERRSK